MPLELLLIQIRVHPRASAAKNLSLRSGTKMTAPLSKTQRGRNYAIACKELLFVVFDEQTSLL